VTTNRLIITKKGRAVFLLGRVGQGYILVDYVDYPFARNTYIGGGL